MAKRFKLSRKAVAGVKRCGVIYKPMGQICNCLWMGNIVALDKITEQNGVKIFLMDFMVSSIVQTWS